MLTLKESVKYKRRTDIEDKEPDLEHLWLELAERNKNSKMLMGIMLTRSQSLPVGIFIANLKSGDWNEKKKWRRRG